MGGTAMSGRQELYACLYAQEFPAQALLRLRPELREKAVVVMDGEPPLQAVCAMNGKARSLGIAREMTKIEVETFASVTVLPRSTAEEAATRAALLECAGAFSPRVEDLCARSNRSEFLCAIDIAGTEKLFGPAGVLAQALLRRVRALGVIASAAVSSNFEAAICHARGRPTQTAVIPAGSEGAELAPLPIAVLELSEEHAETFALWGIRALGALAALPEKELVARLGQEGRRLRQLARGELPHLLVPREPEFRLEERMELDTPVELLESLLFVVGVMLEQLILRATARVLALASVTVTLRLEGGAVHTRTVRPALPSNDRAMWIKLLHLDLEAHPPQGAIVGLVLCAEPGSTSKVQLGLFSPQLPEPMRLDATLARIRAIVGEDCVGRPVLMDMHRPDAFRMEQFSVTTRPAAGSIADWPDKCVAAMRRLCPAERVAVTLRGQQPAGFVFRERRYEVERAYGPWMISGDWWNPSLWSVKQWDVIARRGDGAMLCCCLVRDVAGNTWSMAGLYD
jgi:protein ImuB